MNYTSGMIYSKRKFGFGKYEIRCKLPKGKGYWPAFWTFGGSKWNEIDIFEFWNESSCSSGYTSSRLSKNPHFSNKFAFDLGPGQGAYSCSSDEYGPCSTWNGPDYSQSFHTFTMIWDNFEIKWYIDGQLKRRTTKFMTILGQDIICGSIPTFTTILLNKSFPQEEFQNIIVNLAIGINSKGPGDDTPFQDSFEIDYIKYYRKQPCGSVVTVNNKSELNLHNENHNLVHGTNITIGNNTHMVLPEQLKTIARDKVNLKPGFSTPYGGDFVASIDPSTCAGFSRTKNETPVLQEELYYVLNDTEINSSGNYVIKNSIVNNTFDVQASSNLKNKSSLNLSVYPNPVIDILNIKVNSEGISSYHALIFDSSGNLLFNNKYANKNELKIDMSYFAKGVYTIQIYSNSSKRVFISEVIKK